MNTSGLLIGVDLESQAFFQMFIELYGFANIQML